MQVRCPNCSQTIEVPNDLKGRNLFCTSCGSRVQAAGQTAAPPASVPGTAGEGATKKCPFCAETILKAARRCKYCRQDLPEGVDAEFVRERLRMKNRKAADQGLAAASAPQPRPRFNRLRPVTIVMAIITGAFFLMAVAGGVLPFHRSDDGEAMLAIGITFTLLFGIILLVVLIADLSVPGAEKRTTPVLGLKAFLGSLRIGRFGYSYYCLLDGDKDNLTRTRQPLDEVKVFGGDFTFSGLAGFKQYWKGICRPSEGQTRRLVVSAIRQERIQGDYALVSARVRIESYPSALILTIIFWVILALILILALTKRQEVVVTKLLRRVNGQWYVVNGELSSLEDNAWEVAASLT